MTKLRRLVATIACVFLFLFGLPVGQFDTCASCGGVLHERAGTVR